MAVADSVKLAFELRRFKRALSLAGAAVPARTPKDIWKSVKMVCRNGRAVLMGYNGQFGVTAEVGECEHFEPVLLPKDSLSRFVDLCASDPLTMRIEDGKVHVMSGSAKVTLQTANADEYTDVPEFPQCGYFEVDGADMRTGIRMTSFAADKDGTIEWMKGVNLRFLVANGAGVVRFEAFDGRKYATIERPACMRGECDQSSAVILSPAVVVLKSLVDRSDPGEVVKVGIAGNAVHVSVTIDDGGESVTNELFVLRPVGQFADYSKYIPQRCEHSGSFIAGPMLTAIRQASVTSTEESYGVTFEFCDGQVVLSASGADVGESEVSVPIQWNGDGTFTARVDPRFLIELLSVVNGIDSVEIGANDPSKPIMFKHDSGLKCMIQPLSEDR